MEQSVMGSLSPDPASWTRYAHKENVNDTTWKIYAIQ